MALVILFKKRSPWNIYFVNSLRRPPLNSVSQISPTRDPLCVSRGRTSPLFLNNAASCHFVGRDKLRQSREFGIFIQARGGRKATEHKRETRRRSNVCAQAWGKRKQASLTQKLEGRHDFTRFPRRIAFLMKIYSCKQYSVLRVSVGLLNEKNL